MYDYTGRFSFEIGLPGKSGVSGCVFIVIPNKMGICIWAPRLDKIGNSAKGIKFCKRLIKEYPDFHIFNNLTNKSKFDYGKLDENSLITMFITAASNGNLEKITEMAKYVNVNKGDYDDRAALHLACANGHLNVVDKLLKLGANPCIKDRWGNTPRHEIQINMEEDPEKYSEIIKLLASANS